MKRRPFFFLYYFESVFRLLAGVYPLSTLIKIFLGRKTAPEISVVKLRRGGLTFHVRGSMDVWSVKEALIDRFYEKCGFVVDSGWTIIDIGAGIGEFTLFAAEKAKRVFAFEPYEPSYHLLGKNVATNHALNIEMFPIAAASKTGELTLDLSGGEPLQIQSRQTAQTSSTAKTHVKALSLGDIFELQQIDKCDLMKLDCEGAEYDILFGASDHVLEKIDRIVMEYHDGVTSYSRCDMKIFLEKHGYQVELFDNPVYVSIGYLRAKRCR